MGGESLRVWSFRFHFDCGSAALRSLWSDFDKTGFRQRGAGRNQPKNLNFSFKQARDEGWAIWG